MVTWACGHFHMLTQTSPSQGIYAATYLGSKELSLGARKFSLVFKTPRSQLQVQRILSLCFTDIH